MVLRIAVLSILMVLANGNLFHLPKQVHIAIGENPNEMVVKWSTFNDTFEAVVKFGTDQKLKSMTHGTRERFVYPGSLKRVQYIYTVKLEGLKPDTKYYYSVGSKKYYFSDVFTFTTWPEGNDWSPNLLVFGDLGHKNPQSLPRMELEALTKKYHAVLHVGDFAYDLFAHNGTTGDGFMNDIQPIATQLPYMTCPGNHEIDYDFKNYKKIFSMPGDKERGYFSFNMGPVHFISISTELIFTPQYGLLRILEQYRWLEQELKEANKAENRAKQPWIVIYGHRPMYCSNDDNDDCTHHESLVRVGIPFLHFLGMEKLIYDYGVDIAIWAHEHSYERLWPVYNREVRNGSYDHPYVNPKAPVHIVTGSAGCKEKHNNFDKIVDAWSAFRSMDYGYTRMKIFNSTHLLMEQVSDDKGGAVIDKFMVVKDTHGPYPFDPQPVIPLGNPIKKLGHIWGNYANKGTDALKKLLGTKLPDAIADIPIDDLKKPIGDLKFPIKHFASKSVNEVEDSLNKLENEGDKLFKGIGF